MSCAFYTEGLWYWLEDGNLFGGYATQAETNAERYCVQGSDKYQQLKEGKLKPRIGDFVKSRLNGFECGFVTHTGVQPFTRYPDCKGLAYRNALGKEFFIDYENVVWIAPHGWSEGLNEEQ